MLILRFSSWMVVNTADDAWADALRNSCSVSSRSKPIHVLVDINVRIVAESKPWVFWGMFFSDDIFRATLGHQ